MAQTKDRPPTGATEAQKLSTAERRAQKAAEAAKQRQQRRQRNLILAVVGATALAVIAFLVIRAQTVNRIGTEVPQEGRGHVNEGTALTFKHYPPSSGTHYTQAQPAGVYKQEVPPGNWVHSLEHGYVVALINCTENCDTLFSQMDAVYKALPNSKYGSVKFVATKYSGEFTNGPVPITILAWDNELRLDTVDKDKITQFYKGYVDKGPEDIP
jgi:hypothetical protein